MNRRTIVVQGPLAFGMARLAAARRAGSGVTITTLPQVAARLAGGFVRPARSEDLDPAIRLVLAAGGLPALESIRALPGTTRAVARTLVRVWNSDIDLSEIGGDDRLRNLAAIEVQVRGHLPPGVLTPRDLCAAAGRRLAHAQALLGTVELDGVVDVAPVWRGLLRSIAALGIPVAWRDPGAVDLTWFPGDLVVPVRSVAAIPEVVSCANPRAEAVEALRWMRELIASGRAVPEDIAIVAASTREWDGHMTALAAEAGLPLHLPHGLPALDSREGQACASLADVLIEGLSQTRVRRLLAHAAGRCQALSDLPGDWARGIEPGAGLFEPEHWHRALDVAAARRGDGLDLKPVLMPVIALLAQGSDGAEAAGDALLGRGARALWTSALRRAPAAALAFSLRELRRPDGCDPGACAVWCTADHLAAAPRRFVRLIGLTARGWPRRTGDDPLLPDHAVPPGLIDPDPVTARDRRAFELLVRRADGACVLSWSRRNATGGPLAPSPLLPEGLRGVVLKRGRIPCHAFSESDRLLARPGEAASSPAVGIPTACWRAWSSQAVTSHDGRIRSDHPSIASALDRVQSATSLILLLRDPIGFAWRHAQGWWPTEREEQPLELGPRAFGELVHELLRRAVEGLEPEPGFGRSSREEVEAVLVGAAADVLASWPLTRAVPPLLLWRHTVDAARALALAALTFDETFEARTRSWTEVAFGQDAAAEPNGLPWPPAADLVVPGTAIRVRGRIDRLDVNAAGHARVTDYKTGPEPRGAAKIVLGRGEELQRILYAIAVRELLGGVKRIRARLVFLGGGAPVQHELTDVDGAIAALGGHLETAASLLRAGNAVPGRDTPLTTNDLRLALPASEGYFRLKAAAFAGALHALRIGSSR
jgi:hypothetical protein